MKFKGILTEEYLASLMPGLSIDCIILGYKAGNLYVLLLRWKDTNDWALPGGFIFKNEDLDSAAKRILQERTQISAPYLHQFKTFGGVNRRNREELLAAFKANIAANQYMLNWILQRFVSVAYLSMIQISDSNPKPDHLSDRCEWVPINQIPKLIFDHNYMVEQVLGFLKKSISHLPIGHTLLPKKFTMKELQQLYEAILDKSLDRANFQKKMLKLNVLQKHAKQMNGGAHRAPYLYSFKEELNSSNYYIDLNSL